MQGDELPAKVPEIKVVHPCQSEAPPKYRLRDCASRVMPARGSRKRGRLNCAAPSPRENSRVESSLDCFGHSSAKTQPQRWSFPTCYQAVAATSDRSSCRPSPIGTRRVWRMKDWDSTSVRLRRRLVRRRRSYCCCECSNHQGSAMIPCGQWRRLACRGGRWSGARQRWGTAGNCRRPATGAAKGAKWVGRKGSRGCWCGCGGSPGCSYCSPLAW